MTVVIDRTCTACGVCINTCPERALMAAPYRPAVHDLACTDCWACLEVCPVDAIHSSPTDAHPELDHHIDHVHRIEHVHPIETESYRIMVTRVDLSGWAPGARDVVARMVHATADESFADSARIGDDAIVAAMAALRRGAPVICDARMVMAGMPTVTNVMCLLDEVPDADQGDTRSAAAIRLAATRYPHGALWIIGNAPTALVALLECHAAGTVTPAAVVGLPVGYVGASEAKAALWASPLRSMAVTNMGERGGSAVAAAAVNAIHRLVRAAP